MKHHLLTTNIGIKAIRAAAILVVFSVSTVLAQSNLKEGHNSFARYTKSKDFKHLEEARKFADDAFKTKRDAANVRHNLLRELVYNALAVVDSNRTQE